MNIPHKCMNPTCGLYRKTQYSVSVEGNCSGCGKQMRRIQNIHVVVPDPSGIIRSRSNWSFACDLATKAVQDNPGDVSKHPRHFTDQPECATCASCLEKLSYTLDEHNCPVPPKTPENLLV